MKGAKNKNKSTIIDALTGTGKTGVGPRKELKMELQYISYDQKWWSFPEKNHKGNQQIN